MSKPRSQNRQPELFPRSKRPVIAIEENHRLVRLCDRIDWTELEDLVEQIRRRKLKSAAGRPPHLRALTGAVILMAGRRMPYRDAEDQIRHYAPARYLCGLTETDWTPDFTTIQDFTELLGEDGIRHINEYAVKLAVEEGLADPRVLVADTTAQEAAIPYPNEMKLMASFFTSLAAATSKAGGRFVRLAKTIVGKFKAAAKKVRAHRLFAKTKQARLRVMGQMCNIVGSVQSKLGRGLAAVDRAKDRVRRHGKVARAKVRKLYETMSRLLPQIRYWHRTGFVAKNKIVSLHLPELYSIVRGKVGKAVEFGLNWGIARLRGGYLLATLAKHRTELVDAKFAVRAVQDHIALFGSAPKAYAYDRAGYSKSNIERLQKLGVRHVGLAPLGRCQWAVQGRMKHVLVNERARVEAGIGTIKCLRYGFNRPAARTSAMMGACGQRAVLGFNLNKLIRELALRDDLALVG